jgi:hypothetical protein
MNKEVVQSVLIDKTIYTKAAAKKLLQEQGFSTSIDETEQYYRARQISPSLIKKRSFRTWNAIPGVKLIVGKI